MRHDQCMKQKQWTLQWSNGFEVHNVNLEKFIMKVLFKAKFVEPWKLQPLNFSSYMVY